MHDNALKQPRATETSLTESTPSLSLEQQIVSLLEHVLQEEPAASRQLDLPAKRPRGRPPKLPAQQLWLALLLGTLRQAGHLSQIWRCLCLERTGSFLPVHVTYEAVRKRLLSAGTKPLQDLFTTLSAALAHWKQKPPLSALSLAPFATSVVALDETTLDHLHRLTADLREVPDKDPHLCPGKLAGLFDLRLQRWVRMQFRADVPAGCTTGILLLLQELAAGSLLLADLGYFSFPWFDYLTQQHYFWISRLKERVTYQLQEVLAYDDHLGILDAIVWLGKYRPDRAGQAVRLVIYCIGDKQYTYLTNVLDPQLLSITHIAQLYARRWDIELAFKLLKRELGLCIWWGARPEIVMIQIWIALILAQLLQALQFHIAMQAEVEPFDVSMHLLVDLLGTIPASSSSIVEHLIQQGRFLGLIRPATRLCPIIAPLTYCQPRPSISPQQLVRPARYAGRNPHPRTAPFVSRFLTQLLI